MVAAATAEATRLVGRVGGRAERVPIVVPEVRIDSDGVVVVMVTSPLSASGCVSVDSSAVPAAVCRSVVSDDTRSWLRPLRPTTEGPVDTACCTTVPSHGADGARRNESVVPPWLPSPSGLSHSSDGLRAWPDALVPVADD